MSRLKWIATAVLILSVQVAFSAAASHGDTRLSPRIALLEDRLKAGDHAALEIFWKEMAEKGTPLVEPIKSDSRHVLVTFLWRAKSETKNVLLFSYALTFPDAVGIQQGQLVRLADTDVWFKTFTLRSDTHLTYVFSPNDSLVPEDMLRRLANVKTDPLNPRRGYGLESPQASMLELPGLPAPRWTEKRANMPMGKVEEQRLKSVLLNNEHGIRVYTPPSYSSWGSRYDLLILFDGQFYTNEIPAPTILDNLIVDKATPPIVAVMIDNIDGLSRLRELHCNETFTEFLAKELMPWVRRNYRVTLDPHRTVIGGTSAGGLAAAFAALRHPELFGNVLSNSGSFSWKPGLLDRYVNPDKPSAFDDGRYADFGWLIKQFVETPRLPIRFYLDAGLMEDLAPRKPVQAGDTSQAGDLSGLVANRYFRDVLRAKGYEVNYYEFNGGHSDPRFQTLANGLLALMGTGSVKANTR
jgi:enterochelin esterase-like enzyme